MTSKMISAIAKILFKFIQFVRKKIFLIFLLNAALIIIPLVGFYSIQNNNYQNIHRLQATMIETANWLSRQFVRVMKSEQDPVAALEHTLSIEVPIITSRQRAMGIFKDGTCFWDSRWVKNNDFHHFSGNEFLQKLAQFVPEYPEKEALDADEIISRLLPKIEQSQSFVGIIDYNFTYTLIPVIVESHFYGHALVIFDKWDILQSSRLSKAFILFISIVSLVFGMFISLIYYKSFLIPLRKLVQESMNLQHTAKLTDSQFPVKSRSDEIGQLG